MQSIFPSLPEFDMMGYDAEASPKRRVWDFFFVELLLEFFEFSDEQAAGGDDRALVRAPGSYLASARSAEEVLHGFQGTHFFSLSQDDDLAFQSIPGEQEGHVGVLLNFPTFAAFIIREEYEPFAVEVLEQYCALGRLAFPGNGAEAHGIGFFHIAFDGLCEPGRELFERVVWQFIFGESDSDVLFSHCRKVHSSSLCDRRLPF